MEEVKLQTSSVLQSTTTSEAMGHNKKLEQNPQTNEPRRTRKRSSARVGYKHDARTKRVVSNDVVNLLERSENPQAAKAARTSRP